MQLGPNLSNIYNILQIYKLLYIMIAGSRTATMNMILLVFVAGVVAIAKGCTELERLVLNQQWGEAYGWGNGRIQFGQAIWNRSESNHIPFSDHLCD